MPTPMRSAFRRALILLLFVVTGCGHHSLNPPDAPPLAQARQHPTQLTFRGPAPQPYDNLVPPGVQQVMYPSQGQLLKAWLAIPNTPGLHPAVLFSHGGFSMSAGDFDSARPFVEAGFVVLMPTYRGENGNPGHFERYYGEVDDAAAALDYLEKVPGVDKTHLFAAGHSVGGTTAMLLAELSPKLRGAAACGAFPDLTSAIQMGMQPESSEYPFNWRDTSETDARSPARHLRDLKCPLLIFNSDSDKLYVQQSQTMQEEAQQLGKSVTNEVFPNTDHFTALAPAVEKMISVFQQE